MAFLKNMKVLVPATGVLFAFLASGLLAQQAPVFRSSSQTVPIYATVMDDTGRLVPTLEEKHFEVLDNGVAQPLTLFKSDVQPITVVVLLDTSGSMTFNLDLVKAAAEKFVLRLLPDDRARVGSFSETIKISPVFTNDRDDLIRVLHEDIDFGNGTHLWDAVDQAMTALSHQTGRRVVLVFTDVGDQTSVRTNFNNVLARAENEDFMIYAIGFESHIQHTVTQPDQRLRALAEQTGGGYFELKDATNLDSTFTRVADELHRQYVLGFSVPTLDGTIHKLDVRVKVPGMIVRARKTYLASSAPDASVSAASPARAQSR